MKLLVFVCLIVASWSAHTCRTRSTEELGRASTARVVFTPDVRKGSAVSNTFFSAAEFAGLLGDKRSLHNMLPCIVTRPETVGSESTFIASTSGIDTEIIPAAHDCFDRSGIAVTTLKDVAGELFILAHGHPSFPRMEIGFGPNGVESRESFSPDELAEMLVKQGLACDQTQITLIFLTGGMELSKNGVNRRYVELYRKMQAAPNDDARVGLVNDWGNLAIRARDPKLFEANLDLQEESAPFTTMFALALHQRGYLDVTVTSFRAPIRTRIGANPTNHGPYRGLQVFINARQLATRHCRSAHQSAEKIRDCIDSLLAPCDECMLNSSNQFQFTNIQRLAACRRTLRRGDATQRRSAAICRAHTAFVTNKWIFKIHAGDAADQQTETKDD